MRAPGSSEGAMTPAGGAEGAPLPPLVTGAHVRAAAKETKPSITPADRALHRGIQLKFSGSSVLAKNPPFGSGDHSDGSRPRVGHKSLLV
jgi:hypothetical protein